ncbi:MAG: PAS domain S-box protein [Chloroflexi bacterium]|nr:PAS domain S-box protein [Chloroflexota bacterium]MCI0839229.1 PAS domain S-box protein [Chloroflexota bacterium]MCI0843413.1 PAS domain S-box protein [Chloroflexota bacterium]MCI0884153.1 PAS domain S-box protein [Chloroflexota bacterium]
MRTEAREPREHLEAFERTEDGVFAVSDDERIVFWNSAAARILGFRADQVLGRKCYEVIRGQDDCDHADCGPNCEVLQRARHGRTSKSYDVMAKTSSGSHRLLNVSIVVLKGKNARSTLAVHMFRDVSEARRSQLEVQRRLQEASQASGQRSGEDIAGRLTPRESEVLRSLATGLETARIAEVMGISATTVRNHIDHVLAKLGVHSRLEAVVFAARHRIV